jgi:hypothetical protein
MSKDRSPSKPEGKRERRAGQQQESPEVKELVFDQNPILKMQSMVGNQGVQSLLNAGRLRLCVGRCRPNAKTMRKKKSLRKKRPNSLA